MPYELRRHPPVCGFVYPALLVVASVILASSARASDVNNRLVSRASGESGAIGNADSASPDMTPDGKILVFESSATNLVAGTTGRQVYLRNLETGTVELISKSTAGAPGNGISYQPHVSSDGRYVSFTSTATNLIAADTNAIDDIFVYDRTGGTMARISAPIGGGEGNDASYRSQISGDGRFILFESRATNLVANDTNGMSDGFIYDRTGPSIERVTVGSAGEQLLGSAGGRNETPAFSDDGNFIVFQTDPSVTNAVAGDTNNAQDVFVRDRAAGTTTRISMNAGVEGNGDSSLPFISRDGSTIIFTSNATNLVGGGSGQFYDLYLYKRATGTLSRVTTGNGDVNQATVSADGRFVAFASLASNLVSDDSNGQVDQFLFDVTNNTMRLLSRASDGAPGNGPSGSHELPGQQLVFCCHAYVSADGRFVAYDSEASNLVVDDTNAVGDIFVHDFNPTIIARAGADQSVVEGTLVTLDGSTSVGTNLAFGWEQTGGPAILTPAGANTASFSFTAPQVTGTQVVTLRLVVTDPENVTSFDTVDVTVTDSGTGPVDPGPGAGVDSDGDGIDDASENTIGTNPNNPLSKPGGSADFDGDGVTDDLDFDDDNDGFTDADEIAAGTNPYNPNSKPAGESKPLDPLDVAKLQIKVNFAKTAADTATFSGTLNLAAGFTPVNLAVKVAVGGEVRSLTMDAKGKAPKGSTAFKVTYKKPKKGQAFVGGVGKYAITIKTASFKKNLGLADATSVNKTGDPLKVPVILEVGGKRFGSVVDTLSKSKQGKTATIKK